MISCFMVVKNGISLGYPFVEAIKAALPLCDEFIVSDGYSSDNTYNVLLQNFKTEPKVKLFRDEWETKSLKGSAIRNALNKTLVRCTKEYIMEVDANEIIPESDIDFIKGLPQMYPDKELFGFPYYQILGSKILFTEEFRYRMGLNKRSIRVLWDGYTFGFKLNLRTLLEKGSIKRVINRALTVLLEDRISGGYVPEQSVYLPKPIFRYYSIFPENFFKKMESKTKFQPSKTYETLLLSEQNENLLKIWNKYKETGDYALFWEEIYSLNVDLINNGKSINKEFKEKRIISETDQPAIIRGQFGKCRYEPS